MHSCHSHNGMPSSLLSLRDWQPVSGSFSQHRQIASRFDHRKASLAGRAGLINLNCCARQLDNSDAAQSIAHENEPQSTRRHLLVGTASVLGSTGDRFGCSMALNQCMRPLLLFTRSSPSPPGLLTAPQAEATRVLNVEGEGDLEVFELNVYLDVVALRGSVPEQWVEDFKQV